MSLALLAQESQPQISTLLCLLGVMVFMTALFLSASLRIVPEHKRLSVYRLGRYIGEKGPGLIVLFPMIDRGVEVDVRQQMSQAEKHAAIGAIGEAVTAIHTEGTVEVAGERWNAISPAPIAPGAKVRVKRVLVEVEELL